MITILFVKQEKEEEEAKTSLFYGRIRELRSCSSGYVYVLYMKKLPIFQFNVI